MVENINNLKNTYLRGIWIDLMEFPHIWTIEDEFPEVRSYLTFFLTFLPPLHLSL